MNVSVPTATWTQVLAHVKDRHAVWFQNFNTSSGFYVGTEPTAPAAPTQEFYIGPAASATAPATLIIQSSGNDSTSTSKPWYAYQASGGSLNLTCGQF